MAKIVTDMETWLYDNDGRIFRYLVYKKKFTPFEIQQAFLDETQFETTHYSFGIIEEAVDLGCGEWFLGIREILDEELTDSINYYNLSDIRIECLGIDQNMLTVQEDGNNEL